MGLFGLFLTYLRSQTHVRNCTRVFGTKEGKVVKEYWLSKLKRDRGEKSAMSENPAVFHASDAKRTANRIRRNVRNVT